ncbi:hypothetical protein RND71_008171 [Anisodus tanguticus]|uniref:Uncharacterized protein n=1 Tax=Anisodus tanguticus TaxID=243964 RepID=A0AAE1VKS3_9SOLA|nr:hypothetical protein RND71_008171 [Anisodus tanguticus]
MERGNENEGKGEKVNSSVSSYVLRKDMFNLLDFIERLKHEEDQIALDMDRIEKLKLELTFMSTFPLLSYSKLDGFNARMSRKAEHVFCLVQSVFYPSGDNMLFKYDMDHVVRRLLENLDRVGYFCSVLMAYELDKIDELDGKFEKLDAPLSTYLESSPDILREYLIHLQAHMVTVLTASTSTRNIHVMVEFLLIVLTDVPKDIIHHEKLYVLLARVGALTREVSILVCNLGKKSRSGENMNEINCATLDLLENIEPLKKDLKHVYLKAREDSSQLCFPKSDGPLFMNLLIRDLNNLLNDDAYSVA